MNAEPMRVIVADDEPPARRRLRALLEQEPDIEIVAECRNGRETADAIVSEAPDLLFLDIQMPELDGFGVIDEVGRHAVPAIVFVTAFDEHALRAFGVDAQDYLLKPFEQERFRLALQRARRRVTAHRRDAAEAAAAGDAGAAGDTADEGAEDDAGESGAGGLDTGRDVSDAGGAAAAGGTVTRAGRFIERLPVRIGGRIRIVEIGSVDYFEAEGNYVRVHVGDRSWLVRDSLASMEARLDPARFLRIHRGTIVRVDGIVELEPLFQGEYHIRLRNGANVRSSRRYRTRLNQVLNI
jgi:two-component system, LytTR family, response regulator